MISEAEFGDWCRLHKNAIKGIVVDYENDADEVDDLIQQTLMQAWESRATFKGDAKPQTWLCGIAKNVCRNHVRTKSRQPDLVLSSSLNAVDDGGLEESWLEANSIDYDDPEAMAIAQDRANRMIEEAAALPDMLRDVYNLLFIKGMEPIDVSIVYGLELDTIYRYISRIRSRLQSE